MTPHATLDKTRKDLEKVLADSTALHAVIGAGDLAVAKLREARGEWSARAARLDAQVLREQAQQAQQTLVARVGAVQADVKSAPQQVRALPTKAQAAFEEALSTAVTAYADLAGRGRELVTRVRSSEAAADLQEQVQTTVSQAKATTATAKKGAEATRRSAKTTTHTAKKHADETASAAKGAAGSAKKTATAAKKAAEDTAATVGE